jgi:hypothetical protein
MAKPPSNIGLPVKMYFISGVTDFLKQLRQKSILFLPTAGNPLF